MCSSDLLAPVPSQSAFARQARFLAGLSELQLRRHDAAFATFKALADAHPTAAVLNNLGVVQLRRAATPQTGAPAYYFDAAAKLDPTDSDVCFNLGYAYLLDRDATAAAYWLREALRRNASDGDAHYLLGVALATAGGSAESAREKELARRLSSTYEEWDKRPATDAVPKGLEQIGRAHV